MFCFGLLDLFEMLITLLSLWCILQCQLCTQHNTHGSSQRDTLRNAKFNSFKSAEFESIEDYHGPDSHAIVGSTHDALPDGPTHHSRAHG